MGRPRNWPEVAVNDDGIRPAGPPDACFYCGRKVGQLHGDECVCVTKMVKLKFTIELPLMVPWAFSNEQVENIYNKGSWCWMNLIGMLQTHMDEQESCLCDLNPEAEFVKVLDNTPYRELRSPEAHDAG